MIGIASSGALVLAACGSGGTTGSGGTQPSVGTSASSSASASGAKTVQNLTPNPTVASVTNCGSKPSATMKVGILAPLTGADSSDAMDLYHAATIAKNQINAAGGVCGSSKRYKIEFVTADTGNEETSKVQAGVTLLENTSGLNFVMTAYASLSNFEETLFAKVNMPYLLSGGASQTAAIISKDPSAYPTVWSRVPSYAAYSTAFPPLVAQWVSEGKLPLHYGKTVDVISSQDAYGSSIAQGLGKTFTGLGWKVTNLGTVVYAQTTDWSALLTKIRANPASVIINTDWAPGDDAAFQNQFMQKPTNSLVFEQYAPNLAQYEQLAGANGNGVVFDDLGAAIPKLQSTQQITKYYEQAGYGTPGYFSVIGYNELMLYAHCVTVVGNPTDRLAIGHCFGNLNINTPAGPLKFNQTTHNAAQGNGYMPIGFFQIQNQKPVQIEPSQYAQASFQLPPWMTS